MSSPRVLYVHPSNDLYGSDRMALRTVAALASSGADIQLVLPEKGELTRKAGEMGIRTITVRTLVLQKRLLTASGLLTLAPRLILALIGAVRLLRRLRPQVVYVNTITIPVWVLASRLLGIPVLVHVREAEEMSTIANRLLFAPMRLARRLIANSHATAAVASQGLAGAAKRVVVIYNGMDFPPPKQAADFTNPLSLALVGRLSPRKGQDVALEAVGVLASRGVRVSLSLVGDCYPGYEWFVDALRERSDFLGLENVAFHGFTDDVWPEYERADIVLVPSRIEPFGNVAIEALAQNRPVVASRVQGLAEIIEDGVNGLLVPVGDANALADAIHSLVKRPDYAKQLAAAGAADVRQRFAFDRYAAEVTAVVRFCAGVG